MRGGFFRDGARVQGHHHEGGGIQRGMETGGEGGSVFGQEGEAILSLLHQDLRRTSMPTDK